MGNIGISTFEDINGCEASEQADGLREMIGQKVKPSCLHSDWLLVAFG